LAREGELAVVVHRLVGEADERIPIDRRVDLPSEVRGERLAKVDAADAGTELRVQLFVSELVHGEQISRMPSRMQPGPMAFNRSNRVLFRRAASKVVATSQPHPERPSCWSSGLPWFFVPQD